MTTLETLKWDGKKSGKVSLDLAVAKETSSADLIHRAVLRQLANKRQGTASTLTRSEVRGGRKKAIQTERYGKSPSRINKDTFKTWWWNYFWTETTFLQS